MQLSIVDKILREPPANVMMYLLDTNIASHIIKGVIARARERLAEMSAPVFAKAWDNSDDEAYDAL